VKLSTGTLEKPKEHACPGCASHHLSVYLMSGQSQSNSETDRRAGRVRCVICIPLTISRHTQNDLPAIFSPYRSSISHTHTHHTNHMLTAPMIDRLLCSLVDELDRTNLGLHSLDVYIHHAFLMLTYASFYTVYSRSL
jgi:hypothetical protein